MSDERIADTLATGAADAEEMFYIRDARVIVGNCALWWCPGGHGYTCELDRAGKFTRAEAFGKRETDIPVPCAVADAAAIRHVRTDVPEMYPYQYQAPPQERKRKR